MRFFLLLLGISSGSIARAQDLHADGTKGVFVAPPMINNNQSNQRSEPVRNTSPYGQVSTFYQLSSYIFATWTLGILRPYGGPVRREWLKYNAFNHQLISRTYVREVEVSKVVNMNTLREFTVGDSALGLRLTYRRYLNIRTAKSSLRTAFFEVHYDAGGTALLCRRAHTPAIPQPGLAGFTGARDVLAYFLKTNDNQLTAVKLRPDDIIPALESGHIAALTAYANQQRLDLTVERDVIRLLAYNDSLPR